MIASEKQLTDPHRLRLNRDTVRAIRPPKMVRTWELVRKHVRSHKNEPFSANDYPWTEGICDAWDDPNVHELALQFCARVGKTLLSQALVICESYKSPATAMFGSATEQLVKETVKDKYFPMFEKCILTRNWVPPKSRRLQTRIDLSQLTIYCAWSGSSSTLADKDPRISHAGEVDKWDKSKSLESDSLKLFLERGIEIPDRKRIIESTPSIEGKSNINFWLMKGWNSRWHVPCPHCSQHQELVIGDGKTPGGIVFDKDPNGKLNADIAFRTARYQCCKCKKFIEEDERRKVIRKGVWCPEGQYVSKTGKVHGKMTRPGSIASFQISRIYAPTFSFGDIAREFVECLLAQDRGNDEPMRNFYNSWLGLTWTPRRLETTWEVLGPRLTSLGYRMGTIPAGCAFTTMGIDVQVDHYVWVKVAWTYQQTGYLYEYGTSFNDDDMIREIRQPGQMQRDKEVIDMIPQMTLIDARDGNRHDEVIEFCRKVNCPRGGPYVWPSMGTKTSVMNGHSFKRNEVTGPEGLKAKRAKRRSAGFYWISVNTNYFQQWIQNCLVKRNPGQPYSLALPVEARDDQDFLGQLLNEQSEKKTDSTGHTDPGQWIVVDETIPWDFRDATRYARCGAEVFTNGNWNRIVPGRIYNAQPHGVVSQEKNYEPVPQNPVSDRKSKLKKISGWLNRGKGKRFIKR